MGNGIVDRMIELADNGYICSQIVMKLAFEKAGAENPEIIRTLSGLGDGCGFFNETCGVLTGSVCLISWYAGNGYDDNEASENLLPMLQELGDWFQGEIEMKFKSTRCKDIVGDKAGTSEGKKICGRLLIKTYAKTNKILESYGYIGN